MAGEIVVGFDGTPGAQAAANEALRLAGRLGDRVVFAFAYWTNPAGGDVGDMLAALRDVGEAHLAEAQARGREGRRRGARRARQRPSRAPRWSSSRNSSTPR